MKPGMRMAMAKYRAEQGADMRSYPSDRRMEMGRYESYESNGNMRYDPRMEDGMESRRRRDDRGRYAYDEDSQQLTPVEPQRVANVIGFTSRKDMEQKRDKKQHIGYSEQEDGFSEEMARKWVHGMVNSDGTRGAKWSMEQAEKIMDMMGLDCDPYEFWAVMNALYSDFGKVLKKYGIDQAEAYAHLAKAWIHDDDAVEDKAKAYFEHVVQH